MRKSIIISLFFVLVLLSGCANGITTLKIKDEVLNVEISADAFTRTRGLSGRESLCENCAMVFIFGQESKYSFWMKDMNFPLDILYIKGDEIVEIFKNVQVLDDMNEIMEVFPNKKADKVLELNAGWCDAHDVQVGDKIEL